MDNIQEKQEREYRSLQHEWTALFHNGRTMDEIREAQMLDMFHPAPGMGAFLIDIFNQTADDIQEAMDEKGLVGEEAYEYALERFLAVARTTALRMYRLGAYLHEKMPYEKLTSCSCQTVSDHDWSQLDDLLKKSAEEGK